MAKLDILKEALEHGPGQALQRGALIHEKTGTTLPVEVVMTEGERLIALVVCAQGDLERLHPNAKVRVELPRDNAVIWIKGQVRECRAERALELVEVDMDCLTAERRARRMDVRLASRCRILVGGADGNGRWDETRTLNISSEGVLVVSESRANVGERVEVEFELGGEALRCQAEVLRRGVKIHGALSRTNAALKLLDLSPAQRDTIQLFVLREQAAAKLDRRR
ncbi:MAG: PilZ domain-containing protein [Myxococcales bacterium]|nr:PilZ domain-containing protein [Myxococcales bacterium]